MSIPSSTCPACGSSRPGSVLITYAFDDRETEFRVVECAQCHLHRTEPFLSGEALGRYYSAGYYGGKERKFHPLIESLLFRATQGRLRAMERWLDTGKPRSGVRVLDVGCGRSLFLRAMARRGYDCYGSDIPAFEFPETPEKITYLHALIDDLPFPDGHFDAISIWHVLEHMENPERGLAKAAALLAEGGVLAVAVPNFGSFQRWLFGGDWFHLDIPRHLCHLTAPLLDGWLERYGLEPVVRSTHSLDQNYYGFIQSLFNRLMPWGKANLLYELLKNREDVSLKPVHWAQIVLMAFFFPLAACLSLVENGLSVAFGRGATLILYARKR